jgi:hypothetical protein
LRWSAGGYVWPVDGVVECGPDVTDGPSYNISGRRPVSGVYEEEQIINLPHRIEQSGAIPLAEAGIVLLADKEMSGNVSKERVPLVSRGLLDKLVVNILLVIYVS